MKISSPKSTLLKVSAEINTFITLVLILKAYSFMTSSLHLSIRKKSVPNHNYTVLNFHCMGNSCMSWWADVASILLSIPVDCRGFGSWCESNEVGGGKT